MIQRVFAFVTDICVIAVIFVPMIIYCMIFEVSEILIVIISIAMHSLLICKDLLYNGRSFGKYLCKLEIVDDGEKAPSELLLVIRNMFVILWPIEFVVTLTNSRHKKIGDFICNTMVKSRDAKGEVLIPRFNKRNWCIPIILAFGYSALVNIILYSLFYTPKIQMLFL